MDKLLMGVAAGALLAGGGMYYFGGNQAEVEDQAATTMVSEPTIEEAAEFLARVEAESEEFGEFAARTFWVNANFITYDTDWLVTRVSTEGTIRAVETAGETARFNDLDLPLDMERKMTALRAGITLPAPTTDGAAAELAGITTRLATAYSTGTYAFDDEPADLQVLSDLIDFGRDPAVLQDVWNGWRTVSPVMADDYARMVEIANEGAQELGYDDLAEMWLSNYDMPAYEMEAEVERLWSQVAPLYEQLQCHVRANLNEEYGDEVQALDAPIRADLLGNMWAQQWSNIYDLVAPEGAGAGIDLTAILLERNFTEHDMVRTGEAFFSSLGMEPLPDTFWDRSLIVQPVDHSAACHASAWNLDNIDDIRIKMCTDVNAEDFNTVHHELGHNYYQRAYSGQDFTFRTGAHDGFHEAIGDFVALSITPEYLQQIGLIDDVPDASADIGLLMQQSLDKIAFLPFGMLMDQWRWGVFRGDITPENYNEAWWELRTRYQGIEAPNDRPADAFDPGAKYHIPNNTPYLRYFLSFVMQFQFHQAACEMAEWEGPLHRCSIYGNEEVGARLQAMLEMGASQPWPDALEAFTGTREMDGSAIIAYFQPLMTYLEAENADRQCGW
jgi:peptidyl-dipeptidase A